MDLKRSLFININHFVIKLFLILSFGLSICYLITKSQNVSLRTVQLQKDNLELNAIDYRSTTIVNVIAHPQLNFMNCSLLNKGLVTVQQGGRLGNMIWEAASAWGFAQQYGYSLYLPDTITKNLNSMFENINVPSYSDVAKCDNNFIKGRKTVIISRNDMFNKDQEEWVIKNKDSNTLIELEIYIVFFEVIVPRLQKLRDMLKFKREIIKERDETMSKILSEFSVRLRNSTNENNYPLKRSNVTLVGVHVRRTDYGEYLIKRMNVTLAGPKYFHSAMDYFRSKYSISQTVLFVVTSDDPKWCREHLMISPDIVVAPANKSGIHDLAFLSSCNHSIIDYGTYGLTAAVLAGGETVVYNLGGHVTQMMADMMPNWRVL